VARRHAAPVAVDFQEIIKFELAQFGEHKLGGCSRSPDPHGVVDLGSSIYLLVQ
jgi:hypothetical protein